MDLLGSLIIACSMYSRIPMPVTEWTKKRMRYALCFFPVIGLVIAAAVYGSARLCVSLGGSHLIYGCLGTVIPLLITGGIHLDGYLDVVDARSSLQSQKRKLEILKDPHVGAFAVIHCGIYLILYLGIFSTFYERSLLPLAGVYMLERAFSGWSVVSFAKARPDGTVQAFAAGAQVKTVRVWMVGWSVAAVLWTAGTGGLLLGLVMLFTAAAVMVWYHRLSRLEFGGITGDLAGYFLQLCELLLLGAAALYYCLLS